MEPIVVLHDVSSVQRLVDMARLVYGLGLRYFVATRVYGAAAQTGVSEVMKLAFRMGRSFLVFNGVEDAVELFSPGLVLVFSREYGEEAGLEDLVGLILGAEKPMLVFGGSETSITKSVAGLGRPVYLRGVEGQLGPVAEAAIVLYGLVSRLAVSRGTS